MENSDTEFKERILEIISEKIGVDKKEISPDSTQEDLGMDSLDLIETVMAIEDEFNIEIKDEDLDTFKKIGDMIEHVKKLI
jgi:acyl carrier protein